MFAPDSDQLYVHILSSLTLSREIGPDIVERLAQLEQDKRADLLRLAQSHHVVIRALTRLQQLPAITDCPDLASWISESIAAEQQRINCALGFLNKICSGLTEAGFPVTVIKTLEHWPDMGSDLDLYSTAEPHAVVGFSTSKLNATVQARSWGDRLADKWNFASQDCRNGWKFISNASDKRASTQRWRSVLLLAASSVTWVPTGFPSPLLRSA